MRQTGDPARAAGALAELFNIDPTDHNLLKIERIIVEFSKDVPAAEGYAGGGEVSNHDKLVTIRRWLDTSPPPA